jgi:hypothetical protein
MTVVTSPLICIYRNASQCIGFVLRRGVAGFEAISRDENTLGIFASQSAAATAVFDHQKKSPAAEDGANIAGVKVCNDGPTRIES